MPTTAVPAQKIGRYEIVRILGKGAMGLVYEGRDPVLARRVAIRTVLTGSLDAASKAEYEARCRTEALAAARLVHPNIVPVFDFGIEDGMTWLVTQLVEGDDLKARLDRGERFSPQASVAMVLDLLSALDHAHANGIVHRDVKPANLLIEGGRVRLTDFGIAEVESGTDRVWPGVAGTPHYMSPEQAQGLQLDSRSDLFSAGVVLYELLTGARPFDGKSPFAVIHQVVSFLPRPPSFHVPGLPRTVDQVMAKALAKHRDERFHSARDFAIALKAAVQRAAAPSPGAAAPTPGPPPNFVLVDTSATQDSVMAELEIEYWKDVKDSGDRQDFIDFLAQFPDGRFAPLARRRLKTFGPEHDPGGAAPPSAAPVPPPPDQGNEDPPTGEEPAIQPKVGRYELLRKVEGEALRGDRFEAFDTTLHRRVDLRLVTLERCQDRIDVCDEYERIFRDRVLWSHRLSHPNIVAALDCGRHEGGAWLVSEFVDGPDLRELWAQGQRFDPRQVAEMMVQLLSALQHAHGMGLAHGAVFDRAILVEDGA